MSEHRGYIRLRESLKIDYKIVEPVGGLGGSFSEDISGGGIRLPLKERLRPGTILDLEIHLPEFTEPIKATGEVVWLHGRDNVEFPFVVGIKFIKIDQFDRGKLLNYIRKRIKEKKPPEVKWF